MIIPDRLLANPIFQRLNERINFVAVAAIPLGDWDQLEQADDWCKQRWKQHDRQYRRSTREDDCHAIFEFPKEDDAVEFLMRFG